MDFGNIWQRMMLLREFTSELWFAIPPLLTSISALPGEHEPQKLGLFSCAVYRFGLLYVQHSWTSFDNFWQEIAMVLVLSYAYLIFDVHLLLFP